MTLDIKGVVFRRWQAENLMPVNAFGEVLLWKRVRARQVLWSSRDIADAIFLGNLGAPYQLGQPFDRAPGAYRGDRGDIGGMATAGPWGCMRDWGNSNFEYFAALWCGESGLVGNKEGVFYASSGFVGAIYCATDIDRAKGEFAPFWIGGTEDALAEVTGLPTLDCRTASWCLSGLHDWTGLVCRKCGSVCQVRLIKSEYARYVGGSVYCESCRATVHDAICVCTRCFSPHPRDEGAFRP